MSTTGYGIKHTNPLDMIIQFDGGNKITRNDDITWKNAADNSTTYINFNSVQIINNDYFQFNGIDQGILIQDDLTASVGNELSISLWARRTGTISTADALFTKNFDFGVPERAFSIHFPTSLEQEQIAFCINTNGSDDFCVIPTSPQPMVLGTWVHLTATIKNTVEVKFYINGGEQIITNPLVGSMVLQVPQGIWFGSSAAGISSAPADIANIEFETRELTATEVLNKYNTTKHRFNQI